MKNCLQDVEVGTDSRLEHINVTTAQGNARWHFIRRGKTDVSGASYGVDWWRIPQAPKRLHSRLFQAIKRIFGIKTP